MIYSNLSKRERFIFIITVATIIAAIGYNFIFAHIFKKWATLNNEIIKKETRLRKDLKLLKNRNIIIDEYNSYAASIKNISKILRFIENQASSLGIKTANIRPRPVVKKEFYNEYIIELQIEGTFSDVTNFVSGLIKSPIVITVRRFDLRTMKEDSPYFKGTLILSKLII